MTVSFISHFSAARSRWAAQRLLCHIPRWYMQSSEQTGRLRRGQILELVIERLAYGGPGVSRVREGTQRDEGDKDTGIVVMTKGALPGNRIRARVTKVRRKKPGEPMGQGLAKRAAGGRSYAECSLLEVLEAGEGLVAARCKHYGDVRAGGGGCGGCQTMSMSYDDQIREKSQQMEFMFAGLDKEAQVLPMIKAERIFGFRNKMEFAFGTSIWRKNPPRLSAHSLDSEFALGLHVSGRFDKIVSIDQCHVQDPIANEILTYVRSRCQEMLLDPYDSRTHSGYLRNLGIRTAHDSHDNLEIMVNIVTSPCSVHARLVPLAEEILSKFPPVVCVVQNMTDSKSGVTLGVKGERLLAGERSFIRQSLCGLDFEISANSFFQTNPYQAEVLYNEVIKAAALRKNEKVLDLFCGTGTIGLALAKHCEFVTGIDVIKAAILDARRNAARNNIRNASFLEGNLEMAKSLSTSGLPESPADVVVVDPPRCGLHKNLIRYLSMYAPRRIVYVSCNPATQVRDILALQERAPGQFRVRSIQPIDMFPHTPHIECVVAIDHL